MSNAASWYRLVLLLPFLALFPHVLGVVNYGAVTRLDQHLYDWRLKHFDMKAVHDERIVIVDIDNASLLRYGRWPWRRTVLTQLSTELLQRQQIAVLGFDMLFAEADGDSVHHAASTAGHTVNDTQNREKPGTAAVADQAALPETRSADWHLAQALSGQPVVLGYYFSSYEDGGQVGLLPAALPVADKQRGVYEGVTRIESYSANLPVLVQAAPRGGFMNALIDSDGELRRIPLLAQHGEGDRAQYYPALSLAMFTALLGQPEVQLLDVHGVAQPEQRQEGAAQKPLGEVAASAHAHLAALGIKQNEAVLRIPTDSQGAMLVPFRTRGGREGGHFQYVSAADVLDGKLPEGSLKGRAVLLGTTVPGLRDLRVTPVNTAFPGVEVHALALAAMLDGSFVYAPDYARGYSALMLLLVMLALWFVLPKRGSAGAFIFCCLLVALMLSLNIWVYVYARVALPGAVGVLMVILVYTLHTSYGFFLEARTKTQLAQLFGHYVPAELVGEMLKRPDSYSMQAQSRELTVMFCDVQKFTGLAEGMDPVQVQALLNRLFDRITAVMAPNNGTVDKYIGDCVMAFWGAPLPVKDHAWLAVKTACEIAQMLQDFNQEQINLQQPEIQLGMGINTGVVSVGDMGSSIRRSYTVLGDAVNLSSRLEGLSRKYGCPVVAGARTVELTPQVPWQWLDRVRVAGKGQAVDIYTPLNMGLSVQDMTFLQKKEMEHWQQFQEAYHSRDWAQCKRQLIILQSLQPDKALYAVYSRRLQEFEQNPPAPDWDGVTSAVAK